MEQGLVTYGLGAGKPRLLYMAVGATVKDQALAFAGAGFEVVHTPALAGALQALAAPRSSHSEQRPTFDVVVTKLGSMPDASDQGLPLVRAARVADKRIFVAVLSWTASGSPHTRLKCFQEGANMVTASEPDLLSVLATIAAQGTTAIMGDGDDEVYECPSCGLDGLTHHQLWVHHPLYHVNEPNVPTVCPLCPSPKKGKKPKYPSLLWLSFEFCNSGFWLPGGRVDPGEDLTTAAIRETKEEAGIDVELTGILRWEWAPRRSSRDAPYVRMRVIFYGRPRNEDQLPKSIPDYESVGAVWASANDVAPESGLPLRGREPQQWFAYVAQGGTIHPLSLLTGEGAPAAASSSSSSSRRPQS
ncbi:hydrolase, NUDIX domain containing protein [Acanthamoeba castellanii str. Neff]|uniref:Hydrolase, NUDIX domain containing protein n=1 Tax=Acanthamoeba castellanii (strain ATCC 30010 / Neff) TaxID=1257118 RepID=L8H9Z8_ACACF|nr:hydrolase, NUDIX domain containing protein [Acanthamoeba castellanii str. Neff]ELR21251.1 hydrolase, NUDIX domain containing protein [Acanthamoeba castellanii str. Neff]